jgi:thiol-disulfide isomerase/thioredoxin
MGHRLPILIALVLAAGACGTTETPRAPSSAPAAVPTVALSTLAGDHTELARLANGRVALVSLWATWCESCAREMDALNRLDAKTAAGRDAVVIVVDVGEEPEKVAEFARQRGLRYAQLVDEDFAFADALGQRRVPSTLVVDRHGQIVFRGDTLDGRSLEALRQAIAAAP